MTRGIDGVTFENPLQSLLDALDKLSTHSVGVIGDYDNVSFTFAKGRSRYRTIPGSDAHPTAGKIGELHSEDEAVVVFTAPKDQLDTVIATIRDHHPYEMPASTCSSWCESRAMGWLNLTC